MLQHLQNHSFATCEYESYRSCNVFQVLFFATYILCACLSKRPWLSSLQMKAPTYSPARVRTNRGIFRAQ